MFAYKSAEGPADEIASDGESHVALQIAADIEVFFPENLDIGFTGVQPVPAPDGTAPTSYSIVGGADRDVFSIDSANGIVRFKSPPDFENPTDSDANNIYCIEIQVAYGSLAGVTVAPFVRHKLTIMVVNQPGATIVGTAADDVISALLTAPGQRRATQEEDEIDGAGGSDHMAGGQGNDTYYVDDLEDQVIELPNEGVDTVRSAVSYLLPAHVENVFLLGMEDTFCVGNELDNLLVGNDGHNQIVGGNGNDIIAGGAGNDFCSGGSGNNRIDGGAGVDFVDYSSAPAGVFVDLGAGSALHSFGDTDQLQSIEAVIGSRFNDTVISRSGDAPATDNFFDGGEGADHLEGGSGNDAYAVDDIGDLVVEKAGEGNDRVYASIHYRLPEQVENLILTGTESLQGYGNEQSNLIYGNDGDNLLDGRGGADGMFGGAGNDVYFVESPADQVIEEFDEGVDLVISSAHIRLPSNVENAILQGNLALQAYGNSLSNLIYGNASDNLIDGGGNADGMIGGDGDDIYFVDNVADVVVENADEGVDTAFSSVDYRVTENVEKLVLIGNLNLQGYGNCQNNAMFGNNGDNILDGGAGADVLTGNGGNDAFVFHAGEVSGDFIVDFVGNGQFAGDVLQFVGFGTMSDGARFVQIGTSNQWTIHSARDGHDEILTFSENIAIHLSDYSFI